MFDLHLMHVIGNGIKYYSASRDLFDPLFPGVADAMRERMFNTLTSNKVTFDSAFTNRRQGGLPIITIENNEQFYDSQGLGDSSGRFIDSFGRVSDFHHIFTSQEAVINIYADSMEAVRCLQVVAQAAVLLFKRSLINANYENIMYLGATQLQPDNMLMEGGAAAYGRQLRYAALHHQYLPARLESLNEIGALDPEYEIEVVKPSSTLS